MKFVLKRKILSAVAQISRHNVGEFRLHNVEHHKKGHLSLYVVTSYKTLSLKK